jgi:hypothetical protein
MTKISASVSIDSEQWDHKPSSKLQYRSEVDKFGNPKTEVRVIGARLGSSIEEVTPKSLARFISRGQTWSPFVFNVCPNWKRPRRVEGLFKSCQVFAIDFDNGESTEEIQLRAAELGLKFSIIHHSFSSSPEHPKHRGIIFADREVVDFDQAKRLSTGLAYAFDGDKQCVDVARLYFGSLANSVISVEAEYCASVDDLEKIAKAINAEQYLTKSERNVVKPEGSEWGDSKLQRKILGELTASKRSYVKKKVLGILKDVETFDGKKGSRYECVWRNTSRLARMPEVVGSAVYQWMMESIEKNPHFSDWDWDAGNVVMSAIQWSSDHADEPV